jgi:hypothetical protein
MRLSRAPDGHRTGMGAVLIPIVIIVVIVVVGLFALRRWSADRERVADELKTPETPTLVYRVPTGQDPPVVLAALHTEGYTAVADDTDTQVIRVHCPAGLDRERARVRAVIETVDVTGIDSGAPMDPRPVRFEDET